MSKFLNSIVFLFVFAGFSSLFGSMKQIAEQPSKDSTYSNVREIDVDDIGKDESATMAGICYGLEKDKTKTGDEEGKKKN